MQLADKDRDAASLQRSRDHAQQDAQGARDGLEREQARSHELSPMTRVQRKAVHELCKLCYFISTDSKGAEPQRYVRLLRTSLTTWPALRLSDAAKASESFGA